MHANAVFGQPNRFSLALKSTPGLGNSDDRKESEENEGLSLLILQQ